MTSFTEGWALTHDQVTTPAERLVLYGIAATAGSDNCIAEIQFERLLSFACIEEPELRTTLNELVSKRLILNVRPLKDRDPEVEPTTFECDLNTPHEWQWVF